MSVQHNTVRGYGVVLSREEIEGALRKLGVEWDHDEPEQELLDQFELPIEMSECGNAYRAKGRRWLFHAKEHRVLLRSQVDADHVGELDRVLKLCGLDKTVTWQEEEHLY